MFKRLESSSERFERSMSDDLDEFDISDNVSPPQPLVPQPPTGGAPGAARGGAYNARVNRARTSNRVLGRSTSSTSLMGDEDGDGVTGNPGAGEQQGNPMQGHWMHHGGQHVHVHFR